MTPHSRVRSTVHTPHTTHDNGFQNDINVKGVYYMRLRSLDTVSSKASKHRVSREHDVAPSPFLHRVRRTVLIGFPCTQETRTATGRDHGQRIYCLLLPVCYKHRLEA